MTRRSSVTWVICLWIAAGTALPEARAQSDRTDDSKGSDAPSAESERAASSNASGPSSSDDSSDDSEAQTATPSNRGGDEVASADGSTSSSSTFSNPEDRLRAAERAFQRADFERLPTLLEPLFEPEPVLEEGEARIRARELLGAGYFFVAQQSTNPERREALLEAARTQFWKLLRERPDYSLDSLIFPASVVELFRSVRKEHADELEQLQRKQARGKADSKAAGRTLYIERQVERRAFSLNFFPFGIGQFQNDAPIKGSLFATGQVAALGVQTAGFFVVESLRNANGRFDVGPNRSGGDFAVARRWRNIQYAALGAFGLLYAGSILDAILGYQHREVHIRTLEEPPPELGDGSGTIGKRPSVQIGWGRLHIRW